MLVVESFLLDCILLDLGLVSLQRNEIIEMYFLYTSPFKICFRICVVHISKDTDWSCPLPYRLAL